MADVALVPEGDVLHGGEAVCPDQSGQATEVLRDDRVALVRHGGGALLARRERLLGLQHFCPLQVADLGRELLDAAREQGQGREVRRVPVALDHLVGCGRRLEPQLLTDIGFNVRRQVRERAHGARRFAARDPVTRGSKPLTMALRLVVPDGQLDAERDGLAVDAMRASDHEGVTVLPGAFAEHGEQSLQILQNCIGGLDHQDGQRGVQDIGGGQAQVQVAGCRPDLLGNGFDEGDDVVFRNPLQCLDARRIDAGLGVDLPDCRCGDQPLLRQSFAGQELHLQPRFIFARGLPDRFQVRPGIAINHGPPT